MKFFANPYDTSAQGFYFESYEEYEDKRDALTNSMGMKVEEFEIDVIDGTQEEVQLATAMGINQGNLEACLDVLNGYGVNERDWPALFYLLDNGVVNNLAEALDKISAVCLSPCSLLDAATELFDECYAHEIPDSVRNYIDYESFARDCRMGGDMCEFEFAGTTYTCTNANGI
jgi:hypothetical protein